MKILYLLRYYPTLTESFVYREINELLKAGINIVLFSMQSREDGQLSDELPDVPTTYIPKARFLRLSNKSSDGVEFLKAHQRHKDIARYRWFKKAVQEAQPDLIHVHFAGEAAEWAHAIKKDLGIPYCVTTHAVDIFKPRPSLVDLTDEGHFRCISKYNQKYLNQQLPEPIHSQHIPCGVSIPAITIPPKTDHLRALFIGRDVPKKGLANLLKAWEGIAPPHQLSLLTETQRPLPPGVINYGFQPSKEVGRHIQESNLIVLPCRQSEDGDMDGVPVVLMEALASKRAVLSTNISGIPELVNPEVGWLMTDPTPQEISKHLHSIINDIQVLSNKALFGHIVLEKKGFISEKQSPSLIAWFKSVTVSCQ